MILMKWISQTKEGGAPRRNDCGPACVAMGLTWVGKIGASTVTSLSLTYDPPADGTTAADLARAFTDHGAHVLRGAATPYPYIILVDYRTLYPNPADRYDKVYNGLHWVYKLDPDTIHDPLWQVAGDGAYKVIGAARIALAEGNRSAHRVGLVERGPEDVAGVTCAVTWRGVQQDQEPAYTAKAVAAFAPIPTTVSYLAGPTAPVSVVFISSAYAGKPGDAFTLTWAASGPVTSSRLSADKGATWQAVTMPGSRRITPRASPTWWLEVTHTDGRIDKKEVYIQLRSPTPLLSPLRT